MGVVNAVHLRVEGVALHESSTEIGRTAGHLQVDKGERIGCYARKATTMQIGTIIGSGICPFLALQIALLPLFKSGREMIPLSQLGRDDHGYV